MSFKLIGQNGGTPLTAQREGVSAPDNVVEATFKNEVTAVPIENADRSIHVWGKSVNAGATARVRIHFYDEEDNFICFSPTVEIETIAHDSRHQLSDNSESPRINGSPFVSFLNLGAFSYRIFVESVSETFDIFGGRQP